MTIEVSTISPCYKMGNYLETFLELLPKQTFFNKMEVVLDHNEPIQKEIELVKRFQRKHPNRLKHIIVKKVDPIGVSMNRCINFSKGKYLTIWNIDDLRTDNSIELQYNEIKKKKIGFVCGNFTNVKKFGSINGKITRNKIFNKNELTQSMLLGPFFMFKKKICKKIGLFDEQLLSGADFDFAIRLALFSKGKMIDKNLGYYLNNQQGASTRKDSLQPLEANFIYMRYGIFHKLDKNNIYKIMRYNINNFFFNNKKHAVEKYLPFYKNYINQKILNHINNNSYRFYEKKINFLF